MIEALNLKVWGLAPLNISVPAGTRRLIAVKSASARARLLDAIAGAGPWEGGSVRICGADMAERPFVARGHLGYCPALPFMDPVMTVGKTLAFWWRAREMAAGFEGRLNKVLTLCGLEGTQRIRVGRLDPAQQRRLSLARALLHDPDALVVDGLACLDEGMIQRINEGRSLLIGTAETGLEVGEAQP